MAQFDQFAVASQVHSKDNSQHKGISGRLCIVGDGSTTVGSGIVLELLKEGAIVLAPLKSSKEVDKLMDDCRGLPSDKLFAAVVDLTDEEAFAAYVEEMVDKHGRPIDHAISHFGRFWNGGQLTEQTLVEFDQVMRETAASHFVFAKYVLPALKQSNSASLLFISEGSGKRVISPETSLWTVAAAAVYGIVLAAQAQYAEQPYRINELRNYALFKSATEIGSYNFKDFYGLKAYSNRKLGRMVVEALLSSKKSERFVVTPERLDGEALTV